MMTYPCCVHCEGPSYVADGPGHDIPCHDWQCAGAVSE
jgi:hypothetical protein